VAATSDTDVERAIAAFGAPSMAYRTFRPASPPPDAPAGSEGTTAAFPLLLAALPGTAGIAGPLPASSPSMVKSGTGATPPAQSAEILPLPVAATGTREPASPISGSAWRGADPARTAAEPTVRSTPLAVVFRMLRAEPTRPEQPAQSRPGLLQDLFRRL
jgi:hypothetical protein